jgi:hypothetical protein
MRITTTAPLPVLAWKHFEADRQSFQEETPLDAIPSFLSLGFGCFGFLPVVLTVVALIDAIRVRADWYWFVIILAFPPIGPIAYFVVVRSPLLGARNAAMMSPASARRLQARRRLRELEVQLSHWRGPAMLAEAGEELLVLGKPQEAEKLLRESQESGGAIEDVNFPLAQALEMQGRWDEAVPLLGALCKAEPDSRLGQGPLHLARSLDESGRKDEAEDVLRKVLGRRTVIEAQVRLARILFAKGEKEAAGKLLAEILNDAKLLPRYLQREHRPWLRAAARLKSGADRLPAPRFEGQPRAGHRWQIAAAVAGGLVLLAVIGGYFWMTRPMGRAMLQSGAAYMEASDDPGTRRWRQQTEAKLADYERQAGAALEISPATRALLESRRADLERLSPGEAGYLIHGLDPMLAWTEWE